jgi:hypothetical protein
MMRIANSVENFNNDINPIAVLNKENEGSFRTLIRSCVYGICLRLKQHVLATHQELSILRSCADMMREKSPRFIHVVANANKQKTKFIVNTLMHLGVSCGQIKVSAAGPGLDGEQDVWIFVTDN